MFSDWQVFAGTGSVAVVGGLPAFAAFAGGAGAILTGPSGTVGSPALVPVLMATAQGAARGIQIPLGNNVMVTAGTEVGGLRSFTATSKHLAGDTFYGVDSDSTAIYIDQVPGTVAALLGATAGDVVVSLVGTNEFLGNGPSGIPWAVR